ncbi:MAG: cobalamin-binding protein [Lentisphaerae bacterium]|nr:cobalamin-binding protein [Lentisphaerota bacterium]
MKHNRETPIFGGSQSFTTVSLLLLALTACSQKPAPPAEKIAGAERVVSLAPSLTEIVCAIGAADLLAGRTSACDYPPEIVGKTPVVGGFGKPSMDILLTLNPTLVLDVDLEDENVGRLLDQAGVERHRIRCSTLADIPPAIIEVGRLLHRDEPAKALADTISARLAELRKTAEGGLDPRHSVPAVFVEIWGDPVTTAGKGSFLSDLVALAGGRNIGDEVNKDYFTVSPEWIVARDPDIILCLYMSRGGSVRDAVSARTGWSAIKAVKERRVYDDLDNALILRPGPRVVEGIEALARRIREGAEK